MLTNDAKIVLDGLISTTTNFIPSQGNDVWQPSDFKEAFPSVDPKMFESILNFLEENGYITFKKYVDGGNHISVTHKGYNYTKFEQNEHHQAQTVYNITNANGSIIGNQSNAVLNYSDSISQIKEEISNSDTSDKEELNQIVNLLEMVVNNQVPASKGLFSKFSEVMERNSWISSSISSAILSWLTTRLL